MEGDSLSLVIIILCVVMSGYFSATETAFSSLNRIRIKNMADGTEKEVPVSQIDKKLIEEIAK
jgi:Mg2+/Co2+ transporter CorB